MQNKNDIVDNLEEYMQCMPFNWTHEYLNFVLSQGTNPILKNKNLITAFNLVDRLDFIPEKYSIFAYDDRVIPLGYGQFLEKPTDIAKILELLNVKDNHNVLEIGTGSGYSSVLLSLAVGLKGQIHSIERNQFLAEIAKINTEKYKFVKNINLIFGDGRKGLKDKAPFDRIFISSAFERNIPINLLNQLKVGGKLIGSTMDNKLHIIERVKDDEFKELMQDWISFDIIETDVE